MNPATSGVSLTPQNILLLILLAVAAWAVVELALTLRKARQSVDDLTKSVNETIDQVQPMIAKLDDTIDELQPTVQEVQPLVEKVELTLDEANVSLAKVNGILGDVSEMSGAASSVTSSVKSATTAAASSVAGFVDRLSGGSHTHKEPAAIASADAAALKEAPAGEPSESSYITYGKGTVAAGDAHKAPNTNTNAPQKDDDPGDTNDLHVVASLVAKKAAQSQPTTAHIVQPLASSATDMSDLDEPSLTSTPLTTSAEQQDATSYAVVSEEQ